VYKRQTVCKKPSLVKYQAYNVTISCNRRGYICLLVVSHAHVFLFLFVVLMLGLLTLGSSLLKTGNVTWMRCQYVYVLNNIMYYGVCKLIAMSELEDHPLSAVRECFFQYIRSYPPYLEAVSSIRKPRTRHAVVTVDILNTGQFAS
jgi:hypothetical protein